MIIVPLCIRCHREMGETPFCPHCGARQERSPKGKRTRANGTGYAYKRGQTWTARITIGFYKDEDDNLHRKYRTRGGFRTKKEALEYCQALFHPVKRDSTMIFRDVYLAMERQHTERVSASTMGGYRAAFEWYKPLHYTRISMIKADDLQQCIDQCPRGKRVKEDMKTVAGLVFKYAIANDIVEKNYAMNLYTGKDAKGTTPPFTPDEVERIRQAVGVIPFADYVYCMIYTGFRPAEFFALKKDAYRDGILTGGGKTKAGTDRKVPVSPKIVGILESKSQSGSAYLFPAEDGRQMGVEHFRKICFDRLMNQLGIEGRRPYSCRHTFANLLKATNGSDVDKAALMGHADASMTKYYQSEEYDKLKAIIDSL